MMLWLWILCKHETESVVFSEMSKQIGFMAINLGMNIHDPKKINPNDSRNHLVTFYWTQPAGQSFLVGITDF